MQFRLLMGKQHLVQGGGVMFQYNLCGHTISVGISIPFRPSQCSKKDRWDSGKPRRQQILFCDIQIKVEISQRQIYVYYTDLPPLKV